MAASKQTWLSYIDTMSGKEYHPGQLHVEGIEKMLSLNHHFHSVFYHSIPLLYLADYTTGKYMLMSKSSRVTLGYDPKDFTDNGLIFLRDIYQQDDLKMYNENIFPDRLQLLKKIPPDEHPNYIFSYNFRVKNKKGDYTNLLGRSSYIKSDDKGMPLLSLGIAINLEHYKSENPVIEVVEKINSGSHFGGSELISKKAYYLKEEDQVFTKREKEILLWLTDGLTNKEIANKLFLKRRYRYDTLQKHAYEKQQ
jgi:hypothetical protein